MLGLARNNLSSDGYGQLTKVVQGAGDGYRDDRAVCAVDSAVPGAAGDCRVVVAESGEFVDNGFCSTVGLIQA
jgi:hypothetical protein